MPDRPRAVLASSDAAALVAFAVVGLLSHRGTLSATGLARDALPLLAGWFAAALLLRVYRRRSLRALLAGWAVGVPLGVAVRALALGRSPDGREAAFLATSLVFTLLFVLGLRLLLAVASSAARPA